MGLLLWGINDSKPEKGFLKRCLDPLYLCYGGSCEWAIWVEVGLYGWDEGNGWIIRTGTGMCVWCVSGLFLKWRDDTYNGGSGFRNGMGVGGGRVLFPFANYVSNIYQRV